MFKICNINSLLIKIFEALLYCFAPFSKKIEKGINPSDKITVEIKYSSGEIKKIETLCRIDTKNELEYYKNGGILQYVLRIPCIR